jgi:hypothetical protein
MPLNVSLAVLHLVIEADSLVLCSVPQQACFDLLPTPSCTIVLFFGIQLNPYAFKRSVMVFEHVFQSYLPFVRSGFYSSEVFTFFLIDLLGCEQEKSPVR